MNRNDDERLLRLLDGSLPAAEREDVNRRLREDTELRSFLQEIAEQAVAMGDLGRSTPCRVPLVPAAAPARFRRMSGFALAASVILLAVGAWLWMGSREKTIVSVVESSGSVVWSRGGEVMGEVLPGAKLKEGTVEAVGEASSAVLRFADGTLVSLNGETELSFSDDRQKLIVLREGSISAQVEPQPAGRPMLARTPSAEAIVVGTVFHLSTRPEDTLLKVEEGLVNLRRLSDGRSVEVSARESVVASFDSSRDLSPMVTPGAVDEWQFDFGSTTPPPAWRGIWKMFPEGGRMVASPYVAKREKSGAVITHFGVSLRTAHLDPPVALLAGEESVIRCRLRLDEPAPLQLMLLMNKPGGDFGGNFECRIHPDEWRKNSEGWWEIEVPLSRYQPVDPRRHIRERHPTPVGNIITSAIISTFKKDCGLEIGRFALSARP